LKILLDTHVFLWLQTEPERVGESQLARLEAPDTEVLLSAASSWEIGLKYALGKLSLPESPPRYVLRRMRAIGALGVPIEHVHALAVSALERLHSDPFDRMLVVQAQALGVPIMTGDPLVVAYDVATLPVGA
jgi:PIN domain nuclease of toxin-antitoxin system